MVPVTPIFPFFKLPKGALRNCIRTMHPFEIILLSLSSKNSSFVLQSLGKMKVNGFAFRVLQDTNSDISIKPANTTNLPEIRLSIKNKKHEGRVDRVNEIGGEVIWNHEYVHEDPVKEVQRLANYILSLFDFREVWTWMYLDCPQAQEIIDWTITYKDQFDQFCYMASGWSEDEMVIQFLENFNGSKLLSLNSMTKKGFQWNKPIETKMFLLAFAPWITVENIWNWKCENLEANYTEFTNEDMNEFIKAWKSGERRNEHLKVLIVKVKDMNLNEIANGIEHERYSQPMNSPKFGPMNIIYEVVNNSRTKVARFFHCKGEMMPCFALIIL